MGSGKSTARLIAADVLAYLTSWDVIFPYPNEDQQAALFETRVDKLKAERLGQLREILTRVKKAT
jgi:hypothetical protein